jgi:hypothetical protein
VEIKELVIDTTSINGKTADVITMEITSHDSRQRR